MIGADRVIDLGGRLLAPGFIDCQVNGGGGALFNDDPSVATIATIGARAPALRHHRLSAHADQRRPGRRRREPSTRCASRSPRACPACSAFTSRVRSSTRTKRGVHDPGKLRDARRRRGQTTVASARRRDHGDARARVHHARPDPRAAGCGRDRQRRAHQRHLRRICSRRSRPGCAASLTCSMPCRRSAIASPARSARRWPTRRAGAA